MKKIFLIIFLLLFSLGGVSLGTSLVQNLSNGDIKEVLPAQLKNNNTPKQEVISQPTQAAIEEPQSIQIPTINVNAAIESVGLDSQGRMDVPKNADNVGWYNLGARPGANGNAVLSGHLDKSSGEPAVFWNISKLTPGDEIIVTDAAGEKHVFSVKRIEKYPYDNFPLQEVFAGATEPVLNLITCGGTWDNTAKNYSHRFVVYSQQVK